MSNKTATHNGATCVFDGKKHIYTVKDTGRRLESVTSVIRRYTPPFDSVAMSQEMVDTKNKKYVGMTVEQIQQQWKEKAEIASQEGTAIHALCERFPEKGCWGWVPMTYSVLMMSKQIEKLFPKLLERFKLIEAEKIVFSPEMGLAGQIDLLMFDERTNQGILLDFKTNAKITDETSAFGNMLEPLDHLKNADTVKYGLQLGLYEKMLENEGYYPEFTGYRKSLIHIGGASGKVVKVDDYKNEIEMVML